MDSLVEAVREAYDLAVVSASLIRQGGDGNQTFRIEAAGTTYIARLYGEQGRTHPQWVRFEAEFLAHLDKTGVSVSAPLRRRDGNLYGIMEGVPAIVFTFAEGAVEWPTRPENARVLGSELARLHLASDTLQTTAEPRRFDADRLIWQPLELMLPFIREDAETTQILQQTAESAATLIAAIPSAGGALGPIHGDIHQGNCHFKPDGHLTFFDFSNAGVGWRAYDFAGFLWPMRDDTINDPAIRAACDGFLAGYRTMRPLLTEEERALPAFIKTRDYWETGSWLAHDKNADPTVVRRGLNDLAGLFARFPLT